MSALYREAYQPDDGGDPRDHYPFPQFLDSTGISRAIDSGAVCWVTAEEGERILASAAAVRNIGGRDDRVAEVFGVVVAKWARGRGIGGALLEQLVRELGATPYVVLCEARTACSAGWKVARSAGFLPLGFEPFAHTTPAGSEAMLLTGHVTADALTRVTAQGGRSLIELVLSQAQGKWHGDRAGDDVKRFTEPRYASGRSGDGVQGLTITRHDGLGASMLSAIDDDQLHDSGVIGLRRLEGDDPKGGRYDRRHYVASEQAEAVGCLRVVVDRIDRRARILQLYAPREGIDIAMVSHAAADLERASDGQPLVIVIDVCEDADHIQVALEALGFVPTAYYPALVARGAKRVGGIQFSRLLNCDFDDSLAAVDGISWAAARQIIEQVRRGFHAGRHESAAQAATD